MPTRGDYEIDFDRSRLPMDRITGWLQHSYWAAGRPEHLIRQSWDHAGIVAGIYHGDDLVGCARVVTDFAAIAYLADVYIAPEHRGRGLGTWLVETLVNHPDLATVRWLLHTRDAHQVYARAGFQPASDLVMERPRRSAAS